MSFYTSLTGLNASTAQLGVTSNNIANVGTTGFKRSRADFGDIFATSPLQKASSVIGQGVSLKQVTQEFSQGNIQFSANSLDIAITGDGFFPLKSADGLQDIYTRNGSFFLDDSFAVVNSAGHALIAAEVDSSGKANVESLAKLIIPRTTTGDAQETSEVELALNLPADAEVISVAFDRADPATYNKTTAITVYDAGGNDYLATIYYVKTQRASPEDPFNKWQTHVYIGDDKLDELLTQAQEGEDKLFVNKYGEVAKESDIPPELIARGVTKLFNLDDLRNPVASVPASVSGDPLGTTLTTAWKNGINIFDRVNTLVTTASPTDDVSQQQTLTFGAATVDGTLRISGVDVSVSAGDTAAEVATKVKDALNASAYVTSRSGRSAAIDTSNTARVVVTHRVADGAMDLLSVADKAETGVTASFTSVQNGDAATPTQEVQTIQVTAAATSTGTLSVGGVSVAVTAGDTAAQVATKIKAALIADAAYADGAASAAAGVAGVDVAGDTLTLTWASADGDVASTAFVDGTGTFANQGTQALRVSETRAYNPVFANAATSLKDLSFYLKVDGSATPQKIDLSHLYDANNTTAYTGVEIAREMTNAINKAFGDERFFNFTDFVTNGNLFKVRVAAEGTEGDTLDIKLSAGASDPANGVFPDIGKIRIADMVASLQAQIDRAVDVDGKHNFANVTAGYDPVLQTFTFKTTNTGLDIYASASTANDLLDLALTEKTINADTGGWGTRVIPNGDLLLAKKDQRYGVSVAFDETTQTFSIASGGTGDTSSIEVMDTTAYPISTGAKELFKLTTASAQASATPLRGIDSEPAVLTGAAIGLNLNNKFRVDSSNNTFVVTVDNVTGVIQMPEKDNYTIEEFRDTLETRINSLSDAFGRTVNGVTLAVTADALGNRRFEFTTGTTGNDSFLKVSGNSIWGLADLDPARGTTSRWLEPTQARSDNGFPLYVDRDGLETTDPGDFSEAETQDLWSPIFLDKGELTFSTSGTIASPATPIGLKPTTIGQSGATLQFSIDLSESTQYSSPFAVLKQDQNGRPEGDLLGVDIGDDGLVSASYSNGTQKSLAKIVLSNFASANGLRQIGDSSFYSTAASGDAEIGEAGSAGFGTLRAGATERANVDLTQELVDLITAQRNFQANAKAIETSTAMTQAIIQIRA